MGRPRHHFCDFIISCGYCNSQNVYAILHVDGEQPVKLEGLCRQCKHRAVLNLEEKEFIERIKTGDEVMINRD